MSTNAPPTRTQPSPPRFDNSTHPPACWCTWSRTRVPSGRKCVQANFLTNSKNHFASKKKQKNVTAVIGSKIIKSAQKLQWLQFSLLTGNDTCKIIVGCPWCVGVVCVGLCGVVVCGVLCICWCVDWCVCWCVCVESVCGMCVLCIVVACCAVSLCVGVGVCWCVLVCVGVVWRGLARGKLSLCVDPKRLRVYVQDVSVCTGTTPTCVQHACVLPVYTETS